MVFYRKKYHTINGVVYGPYWYKVRNRRVGNTTRQKVLAYLGKTTPVRWEEVDRGLQDRSTDVSRGVEIFKNSTPFVVLDLETTGFSPEKDKIIEVAIGKYRIGDDQLEEYEMFNRYVDPGRPIPTVITELTRITNEDVSGKPSIEDIIGQISELIGESDKIHDGANFEVTTEGGT